MIGQTFNYLTVLSKSTRDYYYTCECVCGTIKSVRKDFLTTGSTKSCGCKRIELQRASKLLPIKEDFFLNDTPELAYFLGLFLSDGYISKNKQIGIQLQERDKSILEYFNKLICPLNKLQWINKNKGENTHLRKRQNQCRLVFSNDLVFDLLTKWGFDNHKTITGKVPEQYLNNPHFWRGCIDGDGSMCITGGRFLIDLVGNSQVCTQFKNFCHSLNLGLNRDILKPKTKKYKIDFASFRLHGKEAVKMCEYLYENKSDIYLERKYNKYQEYLQMKKNKRDYLYLNSI